MKENYIKDLEKANVAKSSFLAKLSHDMRTPLGAIISLSEFGLDECKNQNSLEYFKKIKDNSVYLLSFISEVLEAKKNTSDNFEINKNVFKSCDVLNQILSVVQQRAIVKNITFTPHFISKDKGVYLYSNEKMFKQIIINLLNNAIKYTQKGGKVDFEVNANIIDNKLVSTIIVSDNGVGMTKEFQAKMFEEFTQEHNKLSFEEEGSGLGLFIVKKNVDLLNGTISCVSEINKGTKFTIHLVIDVATQQQINSLKDSFNKERLELLKGKKILLCEDKEINILIIKKILYSIGIIVDTAINGFEAINRVKNNTYDLVLMDIRMPVMDGLSATREIREFNKVLPIIALSSNAHPQDIEDSLNNGMNAHLVKPIDKQLLFETLLKYI